MKKQLLEPILVLTAALGTAFLTGCASTNHSVAQGEPLNALAFTTVTDPKELVKWSDDSFLQRSLRSVDTYYFQVPDTGYRPEGSEVTAAPVVTEGAGAPGAYETATGGSKIIVYRPGGFQ